MQNSVTIILTALTLALASDHRPAALLFERQSSDCGQFQPCGNGCYDPSTSVCCTSSGTFCPNTDYCITGDNGLPACCEIGAVCTGDGGVVSTSLDFDDDSSTTATTTAISTQPAVTTTTSSFAQPTTTTGSATSSNDGGNDGASSTTTSRAGSATTSTRAFSPTGTFNAAPTAYANMGAAAGLLAMHILL